MAEEPVVVQAVRLTFEVIWYLLLFNFEILRSIYYILLPPEPKDVSEDIVLITGAGHGIGRELAIRFAKLGSVVVCVDINQKGNEETVELIKQEKGKAFHYECDVTSRSAILDLQSKVKKDVGEVSILINNAGIMPTKPLLKHTEKEIKAIMDINVNGNLWTIQAFLQDMIENNKGHIVALSSIAGLVGSKNVVPYCASKFGVRGLMEALSQELHGLPKDTTGIKFTTICPWMINTGLCKKPKIRFQSLMRLLEPSEAADLMVDAIRREYYEVTVPSYLYYLNKYIIRTLPPKCVTLFNDFLAAGLEEE